MTSSGVGVSLEMYTEQDAMRAQAITHLVANLRGDHYAFEMHRATHGSFFDIANVVRSALDKSSVTHEVRGFDSRAVVLVVGDKAVFSVVDSDGSNTDPWEVTERGMILRGYGPHDLNKQVYDYVSEHMEHRLTPEVTWNYAIGEHRQQQIIQIRRAQAVHPEFYPWIPDVNDYYERYLASESSVLVLLGETGTAKTSFIRNMIWRYGLTTTFTYDDKLLEKDDLFVFFLTSDVELLVVEDADVFLTDRENAGNRLMAKFLNISDGIAAPRQRKKIIFTANLLDMSKIDPALMRPGRCFDCQVFRKLTFAESVAAAKAAGMAPPTEVRSYSLAELFALGKGEPTPLRPSHPAFLVK